MKNGAIRYAAENGLFKIVEFLLQNKRVDPSDDKNYAIRWASRNGHDKIVELLLKDERVDPSVKKSEAIRMASLIGHEKVVSSLLQDGRVDVGALNNFAIRWAFRNFHYRVVALLLPHSKKVDLRFNDTDIYSEDLLNWATTTAGCESFLWLYQNQYVEISDDLSFKSSKWASENGCREIVEILLQDNKYVGTNFNYAIRWASRNGHEKIVSLLLNDNRVDPSTHNNNAIRWASGNGHEKIVSLLLNDVRVDPSADNNEAIRWASRNGHDKIVSLIFDHLLKRWKLSETNVEDVEIILFLLKNKKVDPSVRNNFILRWSSYNGHTDIVYLLLRDKRVNSSITNFAVRIASERGHEEIVSMLLKDSRVDPSVGSNFAIKVASNNGHFNVISMLLKDKRVDPSSDNNYAIRFASKNGHCNVISMLLKDKRVDPSADNNYAIRWASGNGHEKIVSLLLNDVRVDASADNNYAIQRASENGHEKIVSILLKDSRVDPSVNSNYLIKWASENDHKKIVSQLLNDSRVNPSVNNNYLIKWASENGHKKILSLLLKDSRVDPSVDSNFSIKVASKNGNSKIILLLLHDKRVDPSVNNNYLIKWACENDQEKIISMLLQDSRVDPSVDRDYCISRAIQNGNKLIFLLFLEKCLKNVKKFPSLEENEFFKIYKNLEESQREKCKISELVKVLKGKVYTGSLKDCKFHGFGKLYKLSSRLGGIIKPKETLIYEGYWKEGKKHGGGKLYHENGIISFYGNFTNDKEEGFGILYDRKGKLLKRGIFKGGEIIKVIPFDAKDQVQLIEDEKLKRRIKLIVFAGDKVRKRFLIGNGQDSEVYEVSPKFAFKYFRNLNPDNEKHVSKVMDEIFVINQINHPHVLKVHGINVQNPMGILMELCSMSVTDLIKDAEAKRENEQGNGGGEFVEYISFRDKLKILYEVGLGLEFLHANQILHRDLKYTGPEMFTKEKLSFPFDVYAYGVMIHMLLFETTDPFEAEIEKEKNNFAYFGFNIAGTIFRKKLRPKIPDTKFEERNSQLVELMKKCYSFETKNRPTFSEIVSDIQTNYMNVKIEGSKLLEGKISEKVKLFDYYDFEEKISLEKENEKLKSENQKKEEENQKKEEEITKLKSEVEEKEQEILKLKKLLLEK